MSKNDEQAIEWDFTKPDEMRRLIMVGVPVRIPITEKLDNHCDRCDHWDICEGCPFTDERGVP